MREMIEMIEMREMREMREMIEMREMREMREMKDDRDVRGKRDERDERDVVFVSDCGRAVPPAFSSYFPAANVSTLNWDPEFGNTFTLSPTDPLFHTIG
jgi:hypothetical protein